MKWERIQTKFSDGTYWIDGYRSGDYVIEPQYIISSNRPIGYNITKNGVYVATRDTLKEAKAFVEKLKGGDEE